MRKVLFMIVCAMLTGVSARAADLSVDNGSGTEGDSADLSVLNNGDQDARLFIDVLAPDDKTDQAAQAGQPGGHHMPKPCMDVAIDAGQKTAIQSAVYQFQKDQISLQAQMKLAMLEYRHTVLDATSTAAMGQSASNAIATGIHDFVADKGGLQVNILFNILRAEQRAPAFMCMQIMRKMKMHHMMEKMCQDHAGHGGHHGGGHGDHGHGHGGSDPQPQPTPQP